MNVFKRALKKWGQQAQVNMCIEECAELIKAFQKFKRKQSISNITNVYEEIADVQIMLDQMRYLFDNEAIDIFYRRKLARLEKLLEKENG